jgi:hypothetical protein
MIKSINPALFTRSLNLGEIKIDPSIHKQPGPSKTDALKTAETTKNAALLSAKIASAPSPHRTDRPTALTGLHVPTTFTTYLDEKGNAVCGFNPGQPGVPPKSAPIPEPDPASEKQAYTGVPPKSAPIPEPGDTRESARVLFDKRGTIFPAPTSAVPEPVIDSVELG